MIDRALRLLLVLLVLVPGVASRVSAATTMSPWATAAITDDPPGEPDAGDQPQDDDVAADEDDDGADAATEGEDPAEEDEVSADDEVQAGEDDVAAEAEDPSAVDEEDLADDEELVDEEALTDQDPADDDPAGDVAAKEGDPGQVDGGDLPQEGPPAEDVATDDGGQGQGGGDEIVQEGPPAAAAQAPPENAWPTARFRFEVVIDGVAGRFEDVTGLGVEAQNIEYRPGKSPTSSTTKMPALARSSNLTMKNGIFTKDSRLFAWCTKLAASSADRKTVTIRQLDENGATQMVWTINAWPSKPAATDMKSEGNQVGVESLELSYDGITNANP